jgi:hypothetical protein
VLHPVPATAWPAPAPCESHDGGLLCNGEIFLSDQRIQHIHTHTMELASRVAVQKHGVFQIEPAHLSRYGNMNRFVLSLAAHAKKQLEDGHAIVDNATGHRQIIGCRVFRDDEDQSLGYVVEPSETGQGVHKVFGLKHALVVLDWDDQDSRWNLVTVYPVRF